MGKLRCNKVIILSIVAIVVATLMASCSLLKLYDKEWIIGKSADEIIERYGEFDIGMPEEDGSYSKGAYMTKEKRVGFLGTDPAEYCMIYFNDEGYAYMIVDKYVIPGG